MKVNKPRALAITLRALAAVGVSLIATSAMLTAARCLGVPSLVDYVSLGLGVAAGLPVLLHGVGHATQCRTMTLVCVTLAYTIVMWIVLFFYTFLYVGIVHDAWL